MTPTRITGTQLFSRDTGLGHEVLSATGIVVGTIEYVALKRRGGGTYYGWRPVGTSWPGSALKTKSSVARLLAKRAGVKP